MSNFNPQIVQLVLAGVVAVALLLQAIVLAAIFFGMRKAASAARAELEDLRATVLPFVHDAREFIGRVAPKIEETTTDLAALTHSLRTQTDDVRAATTEILERTRRQAGRLDSMATAALDSADRAIAFVTNAVTKPMRQFSGILASVKAVVETLRGPEPAPRPRTNPAPGDPEMFV
jgi:methyl-accepting chemotaxis protein